MSADECIPGETCAYVLLAPEGAVELKFDLARQAVAEFLGSALLVGTIVGSGIMGDELSDDDGVALLGNTIATLGILFVLITIFGKVSGAHFNPLVSLAFCLRHEMDVFSCVAFTVVQCLGSILGCVAAHAMFETKAAEFTGKDRDTDALVFGEVVATFGLLLTIFGRFEPVAYLDPSHEKNQMLPCWKR
jgi:glycerol uptake facilitator-like aquaporin